MDHNTFRDWIEKEEEIYALNSYEGDIESKEYFKIHKGSIPILISCPHTTFNLRPNGKKSPELYTGALGSILHDITDCFFISSIRNDQNDLYSEFPCQYQEALSKIIKENHIQYVLEIHGSSPKQPFNIDLGTDFGKTISKILIKQFINIFSENGIDDVFENFIFTATKPRVHTNFCFHRLGVTAVQIEINRNLRNPYDNIEGFFNLTKSLVEMIHFLNSTYK